MARLRGSEMNHLMFVQNARKLQQMKKRGSCRGRHRAQPNLYTLKNVAWERGKTVHDRHVWLGEAQLEEAQRVCTNDLDSNALYVIWDAVAGLRVPGAPYCTSGSERGCEQ